MRGMSQTDTFLRQSYSHSSARALEYRNFTRLAARARQVIDKQLGENDPETARWLLDRLVGKGADAPLIKPIQHRGFSSLEDMVEAAQIVMAMVANQELPLGQAKSFMQLCKGFAEIQGASQIAEVVRRLQDIEDHQRARDGAIDGIKQELPNEMLPRWGRLQSIEPTEAETEGLGHGMDDEALRQTLLD